MRTIRVSTTILVSLLAFFIIIVSGCGETHSHFEFGAIPNDVTWNNKTYSNDAIYLGPKNIRKYLGKGLDQDSKVDVYSIKGIDTKKSIAVKAIGPHYVKFTISDK